MGVKERFEARMSQQPSAFVPVSKPALAPKPDTAKEGALAPRVPEPANPAKSGALDELLRQRTHVQNEKETLRNKANWLVSGGPAKEGITFVPQGAVDEVWARYDMYDQWEKELDEQIAQAHATNGGLEQSMAQGAALLDAGVREEKKSSVRAKAQADADALAGYTSTVPGSDLQNMALLLAGAKGKETAEKRAKELDFVGERLQDTYKASGGGQFEANMDLGRINQESGKAWNDYLFNPTEENRERAFMYAALVERVAGNARGALEYDSKAKWLTQSVAGYLPQWWDQTRAQVKGGLAGAAAGALGGPGGIAMGARLGATAASSRESYNNMRGQAFRDLVMMGVDEATAREAANDEAFLSALIEGAETYISFGMLGFDDLANMFSGAAKKAGTKGLTAKLLAKLPTKWQPVAKVGIGAAQNAATEYAEEFSQQGVSIANQRRMENGGDTGKLGLAGETAKVFGGAVTGRDAEALKQMHEAGMQGAILGALGAGTSQVVKQAAATIQSARTKRDPLAQAMFGNTPASGAELSQSSDGQVEHTPQNTGETTAVSPQDATGARMSEAAGVDTIESQIFAYGEQQGATLTPPLADAAAPASGATATITYESLTPEQLRRVRMEARKARDTDFNQSGFERLLNRFPSMEDDFKRLHQEGFSWSEIDNAISAIAYDDDASQNDAFVFDDAVLQAVTKVLAERAGIQVEAESAAQAEIGAPMADPTPATNEPTTQEQDDLMRAMFGEKTKNAASEMETAGNTRLTEADLDEYVDVGVREHVRNAKRAQIQQGDSPILTTLEQVKSFIRDSLSGKKSETIKAYGRVGGRFRDDVLKHSDGNIDLSGCYLELDSNRLKHLSDHIKDDGDPRNIPLTEEQALSLTEYIDTYDDIISVDVKKDGGKRITLGKRINGHAVIVVLASKGRSSVQPVTAWQNTTEHYLAKYKNKQGQIDTSQPPALSDGNHVDINPTLSDAIIAPVSDAVNSTPSATNNLPQGVGAAEADSLTPGSHSTERTSNLATGAAEFTGREGEATGLERADYDKLFRYQTKTEAQRRQQATNLLYFNKDGQRAFLGDFDPESYQELVNYLTNAPAWNGVMTETAMLIKNEMQGRALFDPMFQVPEGGLGVTQEDYTAWLQVMREHATETGRGTQAWAAWTRRDNEGGQATELEAWENLQASRLSEEERREVFAQVVQYDHAIEQAQTPEALSDIILDIANQRGTTNALTGKQSNRLVNRVRKALGSLSMEELRQLAYASSSALTTDKAPADAGQKLKAIQVLNMLSSPKTTATNLTGNTSFYGIDAMAMQGAAALDMALAQVTGTRSVAMEGFVGSKQSRASIAKAIQRSLAEITLDVDMGGQSRYGDSRRTFKADGAGVFGTGKGVDKFAERSLSALERNMGYALTTTDEAYKGAAQATAAGTQKLIDEGKIKTEDRQYAEKQADELAKYRTFQKDGRLATALQTLHDLFNMIGIGDSGKKMGGFTVHSFGVGDLVAPFTRVAGNLVSTAVDYNPAKAIQGTVEIVDVIRKAKQGSLDPAQQAKAVRDVSRGLTGTMISMAAMGLAKAGIMKRAEDEDDEDVAALNQSEGMTGTQINIDAAMRWVSGKGAEWQAGDTLVDVSRLEPLNFLFSFGAELAKDEDGDDFLSTWGEPAKDAGTALVSAAGDLPVMGTVAGVAKDTLVYGDDVGTALTENLGKTAISSATPNWLAAFAKGVDDKQRSTYSGDGVGDVLVDTLFSRIPGLRETLPTVVNSLGEEKKNPGNIVQRLINAMINPIGVNEYSQSAVSKEMERVREQTGEVSFYPTKSIPSKLVYTKDGVKHEAELTYEQRQAYQTARSGAQMSVSAALLGSNGYRNADAKTQAALLDRAHDYANQFARGQVLGKDSMEGWARNSQTAQADIGVSQAEFFCLYEKYGSGVMGGTGYEKTKRMVKAGLTVDQWATMKGKVDADGNGNVKKAEVETYIEGHFPRNQWRQIFDAYKGGSNWKNPY